MAATIEEYSVDEEIVEFFNKTTSSQTECNKRAQELVGGSPIPVAVQGVCSYSVYAGPNLDFVVQFRLKSLELKVETSALARRIFGEYAPEVTFKGQLGGESDTEGKEPLLVYVMSRIRGVSHLDFVLSHNISNNSPEYFALRKNLMTDVARFFARSWNNPQQVDAAFRDGLSQRFERELRLLFSLPERFHPIIRSLQRSLPAILSLPMVLIHKDFGVCNILVDDATFNLVGVIDWAEAEIGPFGTNLHSLQALAAHLHLKNGWARYDDYDDLQDTFWGTFRDEVGGLSDETVETIKAARVLGQILSRGFTSRLANMPEAVPIKDDETGRYNMLYLDGLLLNPTTKFA